MAPPPLRITTTSVVHAALFNFVPGFIDSLPIFL
jgi:hypothetical protein